MRLPFPPGVDPHDLEACQAHVARCPAWLLAVAVFAWGVAVLASVWVATRLGTGRHPAHGIVIGALLLLAVGFNQWMLPYPRWFEVANFVVFPLAIFAAIHWGRRRNAP